MPTMDDNWHCSKGLGFPNPSYCEIVESFPSHCPLNFDMSLILDIWIQRREQNKNF